MSLGQEAGKREVEKQIREVWRETNAGSQIETKQQGEIIIAIILTLQFLENKDLLYQTKDAEFFAKIYLPTDTITAITSKDIIKNSGAIIKVDEIGISFTFENKKCCPAWQKLKIKQHKTKDRLSRELPICLSSIRKYTNNHIRLYKIFLNSLNS
ncbi:MAG: hypothetical protein FWB72_01460 [Firmicutes bacterium]|nr:hypothetical protein [Bacillota bacterium]